MFQSIVVYLVELVLIHGYITIVQQIIVDEVSFPFLLFFVHVFIHVAVERYFLVEVENVVDLLPNVTPLVF